MAYRFPSEAWLNAFVEVLNSSARYAEVAKDWEGDFLFIVEPDPERGQPEWACWLDLWHGKSRKAAVVEESAAGPPKARFTLRAPLGNLLKVLRGELDPIQAMVTRRLRVEGDMGYLLRNVPVVLAFVGCARQVEIEA
jgi:putative sterol carrier protein